MNGAGGVGDLRGSERALISIALAMGTFMQVLDTSIANVAIPTIAGDLGVSPNQGTWVITSFAVANGISVPLTGWLMQRWGVVRVFVMSVLAFTAASFLCGIAWSLPVLVLFRILQGAVSGPMIPGSQALLLMIFPPQRKGIALAIWSMTTLVAPVMGPIMGGWISDNWHWSWIFFINLPVGLFSALVSWRRLGKHDTPTRRLPIDKVGLLLLGLWVGTLQIVLDQGNDLDWFNSPEVVVLTLVAIVAFVAWLIWEATEAHPIVDLSLFRSRNFTLGTIAFCLGYAVFFGNIVLMPLWLQTQVGYTATWAGLVAAPAGVVSVLISPMVGKYVGRIDARILATIGFIAYAVSYFMRAEFTADASFWSFVWPQMVMGIGMGTFFVAMISILIGDFSPQRVPSASGVSNFLRIVAASFATSLTTTFWSRQEAVHQTHLAESSSAFSPALQGASQSLQSAGASVTQSFGVLTQTLTHQAYLLSSLDYFWISGWLALAPLVLVWLTRRPKASTVPVAAD